MKVNQEKLKNYIKKLHATQCPLCGEANWGFSDKIFQLMEFDLEAIKLDGSVFPVLPLTCSNCGNTYFINVLQANLIDKPELSNEKKSGDKNG